jgi:slime mold repeat-containing protein
MAAAYANGDACTADACVSNRCTQNPVICDDSNACTVDSCDSQSGCIFTQITCDPGDQCNTAAACDTESGCGAVTPLTGTACDAGGARTGTCQSGACVGNNCPANNCPAFSTPNGECYWLSDGGRLTIAGCYYPTGDVGLGTNLNEAICDSFNSGCGTGGGCYIWLTSSC